MATFNAKMNRTTNNNSDIKYLTENYIKIVENKRNNGNIQYTF